MSIAEASYVHLKDFSIVERKEPYWRYKKGSKPYSEYQQKIENSTAREGL